MIVIFNYLGLVLFVFLGSLNSVGAADVEQPLDDVQGRIALSLSIDALTEMVGNATIDETKLVAMRGRVTPYDYILVVEDNKMNLEMIIRSLNKAGYTNLIVTEDGDEAVSAFKEAKKSDKNIPLVFMDINMPNMNGNVAAAEIRKHLKDNYPQDKIFIWGVTLQEYALPIEITSVFDRVRYSKIGRVQSMEAAIDEANKDLYPSQLAQK